MRTGGEEEEEEAAKGIGKADSWGLWGEGWGRLAEGGGMGPE